MGKEGGKGQVFTKTCKETLYRENDEEKCEEQKSKPANCIALVEMTCLWVENIAFLVCNVPFSLVSMYYILQNKSLQW